MDCDTSSEYCGEYIRNSDIFIRFGEPYPAFQCVSCKGDFLEFDFSNNRIKIRVTGPEITDFVKSENEQFIKAGIGIRIYLKIPGFSDDVLQNIESIIEKKIGDLISEIKGVSHENLRDEIVIKIRKAEVENGLSFEKIGYCLSKLILRDYQYVDFVYTEIITDQISVNKELEIVKRIYEKRDKAAKMLRDENVSKFYLCKMCQNATPEHVCIITPDRPSVCGTIHWQEAQAFETVDPFGSISGFEKGEILNEKSGEYSGINEAMKTETKGKIKKLSLYSLYENPHTTGASVNIIAFAIPELNGFGIIDRQTDFPTVNGLTFENLKASVSGGIQIPGFMGIGEPYLYSPNFFKKEGGWRNVVWISSKLKEKVIDKTENREIAEIIKTIPTENDVADIYELKKYYKFDEREIKEIYTEKPENMKKMKIEFLSIPIIENYENESKKQNIRKIKIPNVKITIKK